MNQGLNSIHNGSGVGGAAAASKHQPSTLHIQYIEKILSHYIWQALDFDMLDSAEFTMEKLLAMNPENPSSKHLMGLILYRQGKYKAAASITNCSTNHVGCIYIYAKCCLKLKMYNNGIEALERSKHEWGNAINNNINNNNDHSPNERWIIPEQSILNALLGKLYHLQGDKVDAVKAYASSVRINPFLWDPIEAMCKLGVKVRSMNAFRIEHLNEIGFTNPSVGTGAVSTNSTTSTDPFTTPVGSNSSSASVPNPFFTFKSSQQFVKTNMRPNSAGDDSTSNSNNNYKTPAHPHPPNVNINTTPPDTTPVDSRTRHGLPLAPQKRSSRNVSIPLLIPSSSAEPKPLPFPRRSARIAQTTTGPANNANTVNNSGTTGQKRNFVPPSRSLPFSQPPAPAPQGPQQSLKQQQQQQQQQQPPQPQSQPQPQLPPTAALKRGRLKPDRDTVAKKDAQLYIINLYRQITSAYIHFSRYECKPAIAIFEQLPEQQRNTPWVLSKLGRCHFELVDYKESEKYFQKLRQLDRCRTKDMEYYSTLLWHLRKDVDLSFLAHELMEVDRNSPQAWCTLGNSFSLKRETNQALKCFKRAINIDPDSPYAYTLLAHEQVATEAYESAQDSFRLAIRADNRHYNAWYGLGMVFMRLDNFEFAELHFSRATIINPSNVVLICCIGMVLEKKGQFREALEQYKKACEIQPNSALARYKKARALIQLKLYNAALVEFDHLQTLAPDEASVHFLLGQLYKLLNNRDLAIKHFTIALNLDPKGSALIKDAIEGLNVFNTSS